MVLCLELGADLHMAQLMPLLLTVSCFSKIQIGFAFLVPAHPGSPGKTAVKRVCVCLCVCVCLRYQSWSPMCRIALTRFMLSHCLTWRNLTQQLTTSLIVVKNRLSVAAWISGVFLVSVCTAAAPCLLTISVKYLLLLSPIHWISLYLSCVGWGWLGSRVVQIAVATLSGDSLRQTVHTHRASVHQTARVAGVTAGQAERNGSLPPGLWLMSPAGWLPRTGISSRTLRSVIKYGLRLPF